MDDILDSQLKAELREITENIDIILEKIRTLDPADDSATEPEAPVKSKV